MAWTLVFAFLLTGKCLSQTALLAVDSRQKAFCHFGCAVSIHDDRQAKQLAEMTEKRLADSAFVIWTSRSKIDEFLQQPGLVQWDHNVAEQAFDVGRSVGADLAIVGRFSVAHSKLWKREALIDRWQLQLEVVDLNRADVLATQTLIFNPATEELASKENAKRITDALEKLLAVAIQIRAQREKEIFVSVAFFHSEDTEIRMDFFRTDFLASLAVVSANDPNVAIQRLPAADREVEDAEIRFRALRQGLSVVPRAVDYFVWGSFREINSTKTTRTPEIVVEAKLFVFDGCQPPAEITLRGKAMDIPTFKTQLAEEVLDKVKSKQTQPVNNELCKKLAAPLLDRSIAMLETRAKPQKGFDHWHEFERNWERHLDLLATAAALDSTNALLRRELFLELHRGRHSPLSSSQKFYQTIRLYNDLLDHAELFGTDLDSPLVTHGSAKKLDGKIYHAKNRISKSFITLLRSVLQTERPSGESDSRFSSVDVLPEDWEALRKRAAHDLCSQLDARLREGKVKQWAAYSPLVRFAVAHTDESAVLGRLLERYLSHAPTESSVRYVYLVSSDFKYTANEQARILAAFEKIGRTDLVKKFQAVFKPEP